MTTINELDNIRKTANLYAEGLQQGNLDLLKKSFSSASNDVWTQYDSTHTRII
ncbi:MAG TPA: hypothetical protein VFW07_28420 [Parafilimonas sp.]|nr:hypothetical protein [Parafilimonas sp.]